MCIREIYHDTNTLGLFNLPALLINIFDISILHFNLFDRSNGTRHLCVAADCPQSRKLSFSQEPDNEPVASFGNGNCNLLLNSDLMANQISEEMIAEPSANGAIATATAAAAAAIAIEKPELTCISEEGIADMDLPDNIFDDFDIIGDCITSCNKVKLFA